MANPCRTPKNVGVSIKSTFKKSWLKYKKVTVIVIVYNWQED